MTVKNIREQLNNYPDELEVRMNRGNKTMTVKELKDQLNDYPDNLEVILTNDDVFLPGLYKATETRQEDGYLYIDTDFEERI